MHIFCEEQPLYPCVFIQRIPAAHERKMVLVCLWLTRVLLALVVVKRRKLLWALRLAGLQVFGHEGSLGGSHPSYRHILLP